MDKISGIIPSNARTRSVDTSKGQAVRPGAPAWGRPMGHVTKANQGADLEDRVSIGETPFEEKPAMTYKPSPEAMKAKIAEDVSNQFANLNPKQVARDSDLTTSEQMTESLISA